MNDEKIHFHHLDGLSWGDLLKIIVLELNEINLKGGTVKVLSITPPDADEELLFEASMQDIRRSGNVISFFYPGGTTAWRALTYADSAAAAAAFADIKKQLK